MTQEVLTAEFGTSLADLLRSDPQTLQYGDLVLDVRACRVTRAGRRIRIGPTEFRFLHFLMSHAESVFSREELVKAIWGRDSTVEPNTVNVHIRRLRVALNVGGAPDLVRTVRAAGYALDAHATSEP